LRDGCQSTPIGSVSAQTAEIVAPPFTDTELAHEVSRLPKTSETRANLRKWPPRALRDNVWVRPHGVSCCRTAIVKILRREWNKELDYSLKHELRDLAIIAWHHDRENWLLSLGNELWNFGERVLCYDKQLHRTCWRSLGSFLRLRITTLQLGLRVWLKIFCALGCRRCSTFEKSAMTSSSRWPEVINCTESWSRAAGK
jgi:nuclear transport factor 2 (NTF2) superfamily protein